MERRLAAILAADVVGFSRLMETDEAGTLAALKARRNEILQPLVARAHGRVFKVTGDGVLVEFASAVNAVHFAMDLQEAMTAANSAESEGRQIVLRIGVNLGDVMVEGSDLYGDGVNIAARLEALAEPGSVLISGTVYDYVRNKVKIGFRDLGFQSLKNIAEPVRIYRLSSTATVAVEGAKPSVDRPSVAVLPFTNMSGDPDQEYFSDGITEEIITELSRSRDLLVIARNSSFRYRGGATDVKQIGRELGAHYVVEGSVRKAANRVRVTAQLIEAASGTHLWAERYDRDLEHILTVQDEVGASIVATLIGRLVASGAEQTRRKPPQLWAAYDYFLQGREQLQRFEPGAAAALLRRAIELDPGYAQAYSWLANSLYGLYTDQGRGEDLEEGLRVAQKAVALDPVDSCSHCALAMIYSLMREFDLAGIHYDRAVSLNPNDVNSSTMRGIWLAYVGRGEEALRSMDADLRRDPFPPIWYWECRAVAFFQVRRYAEAIEAYQHMDRLHWWSHCYVAACYAHLGMAELASRAAAEVLRLKPDFSIRDVERAEYWRDPADLEHLQVGLRKTGLG